MQKLDHEKSLLLSEVGSWPVDRLTFKPSPGSWSAMEVLDHLAKVEREMLAAWKENLPSGQSIRFRDRFRGLLVRCVMRSPIKIKVPAGAETVMPDQGLPLNQTIAYWEKTRDGMRQVLQSLSKSQFGRGFVRHPVSGWMTPEMSLAFLLAHLHHHRHQIRRIKQATLTDT